MMLLMAAAEVVEGSREKKRLSEKRISKSSLGNPYHQRDTKVDVCMCVCVCVCIE